MREHKCNSKPLFLNGAAATPASPSNKKFWEFRNAAETGGTAELLLYGDISRTSWWGDEVTPQAFAADLATIPAMDDLTVRICSGGGDVWAAQAIGAMLENRLGTVTAQIEGICASAATIVASHCKVVKAAEDATYMIHPIKVNPNGFVDMEGLKQLMDALTVMRTNVLNQYAKKTGHTVEEVAAWMDATSWWTAAEAKENGFIDDVFFQEFVEQHTIDGETFDVVPYETGLKERKSHWEAGAKQNFDQGLYISQKQFFIRAADYGPAPKVGKPMEYDRISYTIKSCQNEHGLYLVTLERVRQ